MIYKRKKKEKEKKNFKKVLKVVILGCGVCSCGPGWMSYDVFLVRGVCTCVLVDGAGPVSLKGSAVSSSRFWSVYGFSMHLGRCSSFCSVRHLYFHRCFKVTLLA